KNNYVKSFPDNIGTWGFKAFDGTVDFVATGNTVDFTEAGNFTSVSAIASNNHATTHMPQENVVISENIVLLRQLSDSLNKPAIGTSLGAANNSTITDNIVVIDGYNDNPIVGIGSVGVGGNISGNSIVFTGASEAITSAGPIGIFVNGSQQSISNNSVTGSIGLGIVSDAASAGVNEISNYFSSLAGAKVSGPIAQ